MASSSPMFDRLTSDEQRQKDAREERRARYFQVVLTIIVVLVGLLWIVGIANAWLNPSTAVTELTIADLQMQGAVEVCPGDTLTISYTFSGDGGGLVIADATTVDATTKLTLVDSAPGRIIYDGNSQPVIDKWTVTELPPGNFLRKVSVSSPARSSAFDSDFMPFVIPEGCPP